MEWVGGDVARWWVAAALPCLVIKCASCLLTPAALYSRVVVVERLCCFSWLVFHDAHPGAAYGSSGEDGIVVACGCKSSCLVEPLFIPGRVVGGGCFDTCRLGPMCELCGPPSCTEFVLIVVDRLQGAGCYWWLCRCGVCG